MVLRNEVPVTVFLMAFALRSTWHPLTNHPNEPPAPVKVRRP